MNSKGRPADNRCQNLLTFFIFWIYQLILLTYGGVSIYLLYRSRTELLNLKQSDANAYAKEVISSWKRPYLLGIIATSSQCSGQYSPLFNYTWNGTQAGCLCQIKAEGQVHSISVANECTQSLLSKGCYNIAPTKSEKITVWKGKKHLCGKFDSGSFYDSPTDCVSNASATQKCGGGDLLVCRPKGQKCPITSFWKKIPNSLTSVTNVTLDSSNIYYYERNMLSKQSYPISSFQINEFSTCSQLEAQNISPNRSDLEILNTVRESCNNTLNRSITEIESQGEETLFKLNPIMYDKINKIPSYPRPADEYQWSLSYSGYQAWSISCRKSNYMSMKAMGDKISLESEFSYLLLMQIALITSVSIVSIIVVYLEISRKFKRQYRVYQFMKQAKQDPQFKKFKIQESEIPMPPAFKKTGKYLLILDFIGKLIISPIVVLSAMHISDQIAWHNYVKTQNCSDQFYQTAIGDPYVKSLTFVYNNYSTIIAVWAISVGIYVIHACFRMQWEFGSQPQKKKVVAQVPADQDPLSQAKKLTQRELEELEMQEWKREQEEKLKTVAIFTDNDILSQEKNELVPSKPLKEDPLLEAPSPQIKIQPIEEEDNIQSQINQLKQSNIEMSQSQAIRSVRDDKSLLESPLKRNQDPVEEELDLESQINEGLSQTSKLRIVRKKKKRKQN